MTYLSNKLHAFLRYIYTLIKIILSSYIFYTIYEYFVYTLNYRLNIIDLRGDINLNILEKITTLREERHWTEYQLAERSGLTQSTISSWYRKNLLPTIPSLIKICDAFEITLSHFFLEDSSQSVVLNDRQLQLLESASKLDKEQIDSLIEFLNKI